MILTTPPFSPDRAILAGSLHPLPCILPTAPHSIRKLSMGRDHALALTSTGLLLSWGSNECGQLGTGSSLPLPSPRIVHALSSVEGVEVSCGPRCSGLISSSLQLYAWGEHQPSSLPCLFHPSWANGFGKSDCGLNSKAVAFGAAHSLVLTQEGRVW